MSDRQRELAVRLAAVLSEIGEACAAAGRDPAEVELVAVSKTWPASDVAILHGLGVAEFGENRLDELQAKAAELADRGLRWHFLGQIQSKKAAAVGRAAQVVESVDRAKVVAALGAGARDAGGEVAVFIQVSLAAMAGSDQAVGRGGADPQDVPMIADAVAEEASLRLAGVMLLPPRSLDPARAFARIAEISGDLQHRHPGASAVSAGMSHDFGAAIRAGATHVRIGSALFGERPTVR